MPSDQSTAGEQRKVFVRAEWTQELDTEKVEEWVKANFDEDQAVQVQDAETEEYYYAR